MDFDLRLLRCALAVAEHRNFARAARAVHLSQPAVSRAIQELEQRAGTNLFDRTSGGVEPTAAGALFLEHAKDVMSRASDLGREMDLLKGLEKGELRIGAGTYPSNMFVDRAIGRLLREHPHVRISVINDNFANLLPLLRKRELDMAVMDGTVAANDPELEVAKLLNHTGYLVLRAGHPLLKKKQSDPVDESWNYPFVTTSRFNTAMFKELAGVLLGARRAARLGTKSLVSVACESLSMMKTVALESDAVALLPLNVMAGELERGDLVAMPAPDWVRANFAIVRLAHRSLSPLGETFVRIVQDADAELLAWEEKTAKRLFQLPPPGKPIPKARRPRAN
jgi:DNA-binding transcriptional LysR family regulator